MFDFHSFMLFKQLKSMRLLDLVFSCFFLLSKLMKLSKWLSPLIRLIYCVGLDK